MNKNIFNNKIKYRIWDFQFGIWVDPKENVAISQDGYVCSPGIQSCSLLKDKTARYFVSRFTGLIDVNQEYIYEGDIVKITIGGTNHIRIVLSSHVKEIKDFTFEKFCLFSKDLLVCDYPQVDNADKIVKLGSIFENADLL